MMIADDDRGDEEQPAASDLDRDGALSRAFLLRRGFCCELGCKNCPYRQERQPNE